MKWRDKQRNIKCACYFGCILFLCLFIWYLWPRHRLHIYWVNMDSNLERRNDMEKHLKSVSIPQTRIVATDVAFVKNEWNNIQHKGIVAYDPAPYTNTWKEHVYRHRYMYVEFAVTISHLRAIQRAWEDGCEYALILEDDARVSKNFKREWYSYIHKAPDDWHMINFYTTNAQAVLHLNSIRDPFVHWKAWYWGASAYMLNRKGMARILQQSRQGEHFLFNDRIVVVDEYLASAARYTYQATAPYIFTSGALSTQQISDTFMLDPTYGNKINTLLRQQDTSVVAAPAQNILIITHLDTSDDLEWLKKEIHYVSSRHHGIVQWAVHQTHFQLPEHAFYFGHMETLMSKDIWDLVLMKHPSLSLHGFAWQTFLQFSTCATIVGAMPVHVDHFNLRGWSKWSTERPFDPFKLRNWAQGNGLDLNHGHGAYGELRPVPFDIIPTTFALMNASFFKWYIEKQTPPDQYCWCGAASEWKSDSEACAMLPVGIHQWTETLPTQTYEKIGLPNKLRGNILSNRTLKQRPLSIIFANGDWDAIWSTYNDVLHSNVLRSMKWRLYSKSFVEQNSMDKFYERNMVNSIRPYRFKKTCHMVIAAGMPRSGSTWIQSMMEHFLSINKLSFGQRYFNNPLHVHLSEEKSVKWYIRELQLWATENIFIYKSHAFEPELLNICDKTLVITSHRTLDQVALSKLNVGWVSNGLKALNGIHTDYNNYAKWLEVGALDIDYDRAILNKKGTYVYLANKLAQFLDKRTYVRTAPSLHKQANVAIQSTKKWSMQHIMPSILAAKLTMETSELGALRWSHKISSVVHSMLEWTLHTSYIYESWVSGKGKLWDGNYEFKHKSVAFYSNTAPRIAKELFGADLIKNHACSVKQEYRPTSLYGLETKKCGNGDTFHQNGIWIGMKSYIHTPELDSRFKDLVGKVDVLVTSIGAWGARGTRHGGTLTMKEEMEYFAQWAQSMGTRIFWVVDHINVVHDNLEPFMNVLNAIYRPQDVIFFLSAIEGSRDESFSRILLQVVDAWIKNDDW